MLSPDPAGAPSSLSTLPLVRTHSDEGYGLGKTLYVESPHEILKCFF